MKVGVLTLIPKNNYGGILQAIALCAYLEKSGHEVVLINKSRFKKNILENVVIGILERLPFQNIKNKRGGYLKTNQLKGFVEANLPRKSKEIISSQDLTDLVESESFDAVIVGSDQVWRYEYIRDGHHNVFFLDFNSFNPVKKIAYAASFGKSEWEAPSHITEISGLLADFNAISTREKSGVKICAETFGISSAVSVLDPTMLVGADFYNRFFDGFKDAVYPSTIATYILDQSQEKQEVVNAVLEEVSGSFRRVNLSEQRGDGFYSVEEWLWNIKNADFVVTDSFHGMAFCILFKKQFLVVGNESRGLSRFTDLLGEVGLLDRLVLTREVVPSLIKNKINYLDKEKILAAMRGDSINFLCKSMGSNN